jgi:hypothetical protein
VILSDTHLHLFCLFKGQTFWSLPLFRFLSFCPSTYHKDDSNGEYYLTFEPDGGGWNNIRMAMETIVALAIAMKKSDVGIATGTMHVSARQ